MISLIIYGQTIHVTECRVVGVFISHDEMIGERIMTARYVTMKMEPIMYAVE